ncbi:class I SAM-dependent methyltransferase [Streptomyces sp. GS7]|uniref:class I SAM-dependent methyltransferase n=1 Tax=Streptomyces sp. GS7 TaxID=2692234 RepID=UPI0013189113|nr:class I SAM-dependent methyltransferase [Streptomyces sp. GS7]QHC26373.1 methyltransferase domain-containing protein [Streptomyces sp. GS7]
MAATLVPETRSPDYWDHAYWKGARFLSVGREERQLLRAYTQLKSGQFAVDAGCGRGSLAATMNGWGLNVLALDFSEVAIDAARNTFQEFENLRFDRFDFNADSEHHMLQPGTVDLITCRLTFAFLDRPRFLGDCRRWLKADTGTLHITTAVHELAPPEHAHRGLTLAEINALDDGHWQHVTRYPITLGGSVQGIVLRGPIR